MQGRPEWGRFPPWAHPGILIESHHTTGPLLPSVQITGFTLQHVEVSHDDGYDEDTGYDGSPGSKDGAGSAFHLTTTGFAARAAGGGGPSGGFRSGDAGGGGGDDHDDDARAGVRDGGATDEQRQSPIGDTYYTDEYRSVFKRPCLPGPCGRL